MTDIPSEPSQDTAALAHRRRMLLRISYGLLGTGIALAVLAALVGGAAAHRSALSVVNTALLLRNVAAALLLLGLSVVLIAQRLPELQRRWSGFGRQAVGRWGTSTADGMSQVGRRLAGLIAAFFLIWLLIGGLPLAARGLAVLIASVALPAVMAVVSLYGSGPLRAFCLGCLFPLFANLIFISVLAASVWLSAWAGNRYYRLLDLLGQYYGAALFTGALAATTGLLCMGVRQLLVGSGSAEQPTDRDAARGATDQAPPARGTTAGD